MDYSQVKNNDIDTPIIVIGFPRSGTTLMLHILQSSGEFPTYNFSETHYFSHYYRRYGALSKKKNKEKFLSEISKSEWFKNSSITMEELIQHTQPYENIYESYFKSFMALIAHKNNKIRWVEKTPYHMLYLPEINQTLPDAKYILVVRDPRDSVLSVLSYGWSGGLFGGVSKVATAWNWYANHTRNTLNTLDLPYITVKYEDLTKNTETVLNTLNAFLNIKLDINHLNKDGVGVLKKSNSSYENSDNNSNNNESKSNGISASGGRWKEKMSLNDIHAVEYITHENLNRYGYESVSQKKPALSQRMKLIILIDIYALHKWARRLLFPLLRR